MRSLSSSVVSVVSIVSFAVVLALILALSSLSGCASAPPPPRYVIEATIAPLASTAANLAGQEVATRLRDEQVDVAHCFDEMADRREVTAQQQVSLEVMVRGGQAVLVKVRPRSVDTVVDAALHNCLGGIVDSWRWSGDDTDVIAPLAVAPRRNKGLAARWTPPPNGYQPRERSGE
jgi:hypothetical protein